MSSRPESPTEVLTAAQSCQLLMDFISGKRSVSFNEISDFIKDKKLRFFEPPLFVVDNDPAHRDPHPLVEYLMLQQAMGTIRIDRENETVRWLQPVPK